MTAARNAHWDRRHFLQVGGLGLFGLTLPQLLQLESSARAAGKKERPRSCIFLFLYGGPSQIDIWDMKPEAPDDYRGEFKPAATAVPGTYMCEHLPRMAQLAKHYSIVRTLHHKISNHQPAGCYLLTGVDPQSNNNVPLRRDDPPALGSLAARLAPTPQSSVPPVVMLPVRVNDQGNAIRGQTGGWLGSHADPLLINQDPNAAGFRVGGYERQEDVSLERLDGRRQLGTRLDNSPIAKDARTQPLTDFQQTAFDLVTRSQGQSAFDLSAESRSVRDRYGRNPFGQSCLLARRLIEAGTRMVTVSSCDSTGGTEWDTHGGTFSRLKGTLLPRLDLAYSALMEDLLARGLLQDTVVYLGGEFGRTPRLGQAGFSGAGASKDGRDHYPHCFTGIMAGGRVRPGMVYGTSDSKAATPAKDPVSMEDLAATLFAGMDIDPDGIVYTRDNRPMAVTHGKVIQGLLS
jgi:hypothetical protein